MFARHGGLQVPSKPAAHQRVDEPPLGVSASVCKPVSCQTARHRTAFMYMGMSGTILGVIST
jgi:hypothetical protein